MRGERSWFAIDFKSFEIPLEEVGGKLLGRILVPLCIFWSVWKERNLLAFGNEVLSIQRLKHSFVCNLWSWVRVFIVLSLRSLVSFFEWLGFNYR